MKKQVNEVKFKNILRVLDFTNVQPILWIILQMKNKFVYNLVLEVKCTRDLKSHIFAASINKCCISFGFYIMYFKIQDKTVRPYLTVGLFVTLGP